ncbi:MAG: T9SS type B sorting domain-containing protein [Luteibaculaceae bacterium]
MTTSLSIQAQNFLETFGTGFNAGLPPGQTTYALLPSWNSCNPTPPQDGQYVLTSNTAFSPLGCPGVTLPVGHMLFNTWHQPLQDKTGDDMGRYLIVNGSFAPGTFYTRTVTGLIQGSNYEFSAWIANLLRGGACGLGEQPVSVTFRILDGTTQIAAINTDTVPGFNSLGVFVAPNAPQSAFQELWQEVVLNFTATSSTLTLQLLNAGPGGCGNDLAIDDIAFTTCDAAEIVNISGDLELCEVFSTTLTATGPEEGTWVSLTPGVTFSSTFNSTTQVNNLQADAPSFIVWNTEVCNIPYSDTVQVMVNVNPSVSIELSNQTPCLNEEVTITLTGTFNADDEVIWSFQNANLETFQGITPEGIFFTQPGSQIISVIVNSATCGSVQTEIEIQVQPSIEVNFTVSPLQGCSPLEVAFNDVSVNAFGNYSRSWVVGDDEVSTEEEFTLVFAEPGNYNVSLFLSNLEGCSLEESLSIEDAFTVFPKPNMELEILPDTLVALASANFSIMSFNELGGECTFLFNGITHNDCFFEQEITESGTFPLFYTITNEFGCTDSATILITITAEIFVPNIISPNNDGINDNWLLKGDLSKITRVFIYNRWGKTIFEQNSYNNTNAFRGESNGKALPEGTYFYVIEFEGSQPAKGNLTIVR